MKQKLKDLTALLIMGHWSEGYAVCRCEHDDGCHGCPVPDCDSCGASVCLVVGCECNQMSERRYQWRKYFSGCAFRAKNWWRFYSSKLRQILLNQEPEICEELKTKYKFDAEWKAEKSTTERCQCSVCWPGGGIDYAAATEDSPLTGAFASEQLAWWEEGGDE